MLTVVKFSSFRKCINSTVTVCARSMARFRRSDTPPPNRELQKRKIFYMDESPPEKYPIQPYQRRTMRRAHPERQKYVKEYSEPFPKGKVYERFPQKIPLEAGRNYAWCTCGHSHKQPFCDGAHKTMEGTSFTKHVKKFRPHRFTVDESKEYYLCNCKQTDNRPFCDGTHKTLVDPRAVQTGTPST